MQLDWDRLGKYCSLYTGVLITFVLEGGGVGFVVEHVVSVSRGGHSQRHWSISSQGGWGKWYKILNFTETDCSWTVTGGILIKVGGIYKY